MSIKIYLGNPPENVRSWIIENYAPSSTGKWRITIDDPSWSYDTTFDMQGSKQSSSVTINDTIAINLNFDDINYDTPTWVLTLLEFNSDSDMYEPYEQLELESGYDATYLNFESTETDAYYDVSWIS